MQLVQPALQPEPEAIKSSRIDNNRQLLQHVNVQPVQQPSNSVPESESIKSHPNVQVKQDENLLHQSSYMPGTSPDLSRLSTRSPQAHPKQFNPTVNTFPRRSSPSIHSPLNTVAPAAAQGTRTAGYAMFRVCSLKFYCYVLEGSRPEGLPQSEKTDFTYIDSPCVLN